MSGTLPFAQAGSVTPLLGSGFSRTLNITGAAVMVKVGPGRLYKVFINTLSAGITIFSDLPTTSGAAAANLIFTIPANAAVGAVYDIDCPFLTGLLITPGASGVLTVVYS